jgi:hypothetical protein
MVRKSRCRVDADRNTVFFFFISVQASACFTNCLPHLRQRVRGGAGGTEDFGRHLCLLEAIIVDASSNSACWYCIGIILNIILIDVGQSVN